MASANGISIPEGATWKTTYSDCLINAPQQFVWDVLTDFEGYDTWNSFTYDVQMPRFAVGEIFEFKVKLKENNIRQQQECITVIDAPHVVGWRYPFEENIWLAPIRYQVLTPISATQTRYQTWETFNGLLAPLLRLTVLGQVQRGFDACASDLKRYCEAHQ